MWQDTCFSLKQSQVQTSPCLVALITGSARLSCCFAVRGEKESGFVILHLYVIHVAVKRQKIGRRLVLDQHEINPLIQDCLLWICSGCKTQLTNWKGRPLCSFSSVIIHAPYTRSFPSMIIHTINSYMSQRHCNQRSILKLNFKLQYSAFFSCHLFLLWNWFYFLVKM